PRPSERPRRSARRRPSRRRREPVRRHEVARRVRNAGRDRAAGGLPGGRVTDARSGGDASPRRARSPLRRDGVLRLLVRAGAAAAPGRDRRGGTRRDRDGAPPALPGQRAGRRSEVAALTLRSAHRELRRDGRLPAGGRERIHPSLGAPAPHPRARRAQNRMTSRARPKTRVAKAWAGRIATPAAPLAEAFTTSLPVDRRLYPYDITGSIAHVHGLVRARLLTRREGARLE